MAKTETMKLKVIVPHWRVKVCRVVLAPLWLLPPSLRDRVAEFLAPYIARWILEGVRFD